LGFDPRARSACSSSVIHIFAERDTVELVERGLVEPFTDAVRLRALGLGVRVTTEQKIIRAKVGLLELVKQLGNVSVKLLRALTDRGSEFCGNPERHDYGLYLAVEEIHHSRSKTKSPQTADGPARSPVFAATSFMTSETLAPCVDRLLADPVPLGHHRHWLAIRLADDRNHLLFNALCGLLPPNREPASHVIPGPKSLGQVTPTN
jgi:hypothetical protein